jgi:hypothetical protein
LKTIASPARLRGNQRVQARPCTWRRPTSRRGARRSRSMPRTRRCSPPGTCWIRRLCTGSHARSNRSGVRSRS